MRIHAVPGILVRSVTSCALLLIGLALPAHAHDVWHGKIQVLSPTPDETYTSVPLEVRIKITGLDHDGDKDDVFHVRLNGENITRRLGPPVKNVYRVFLYNRNLLLGKNRITVRTRGEEVKVNFEYAPKAPTKVGATPSVPTYVPIKTRVISGDGKRDSDFAIMVGSTPYSAPVNPDGPGSFQLLLLDRHDLHMVSNQTVIDLDPISFDQLLQSPALTQNCEEWGCIAVLQSLQNGYWGIDPAGAGIPFIGGTQQIVNVVNSVNNGGSFGYSLITVLGNPNNGAHEGTGYERLECQPSSGDACQGAPIVGQGNAQISGMLMLDNMNAYKFVNADRVTFSTGTTPDSSSNGVIVGNNTYWSDNLQGEGGFQLVILDGSSLNLVSNNTFRMSQLGQLDNLINSSVSINRLFIISSIGSVSKPSSAANGLLTWYAFEDTLREIGGTYAVIDQLRPGDDYSLIGSFSDPNYGPSSTTSSSGYLRFAPQEASSVIFRATQPVGAPVLASNLRGYFKRDHQGYYAPQLANLTSTFNTSTDALLDMLALQQPVPWPDTDKPGELAAYAWMSQQACTVKFQPLCKSTDIRASYSNPATPFSVYYTNINSLQWQDSYTSLGFNQTDFDALQSQLEAELAYVQTIDKFQTELQSLFNSEQANVGLLLNDDYGKVNNSLYIPQPPPSDPALFDALDVITGALSVASYFTPVGPAVQAGLDAGSVAVNLGVELSENSQGKSSTSGANQQGQLLSTYSNLSGNAANQFADSMDAMGNLFDLILSDWGKLSTLGSLRLNNEIQFDEGIAAGLVQAYDRSVRKQYLISLMSGVFSIEHDINISGHGKPPTGWLWRLNVANTFVNQPAEWELPAGPDGDQPGPGEDGQYYDSYGLWNLPLRGIFVGGPVSSQLLGPFFGAIDLNDPTQLGEYPYWFYARDNGIPRGCANGQGPRVPRTPDVVSCPETGLTSFSPEY